MRVRLSRYFQTQESPIKAIKQRIKLQKIQDKRRTNKRSQTQETQVIDPLNQQWSYYQDQVSKSLAIHKSKAYKNLRDYIDQQNKNLKWVRLNKINSKKEKKVKTEISEPEMTESQIITVIPEVDYFFRNQTRDTLLHQNRQLRKQIQKILNSVEDNVKQYSPLKSQSVYIKPETTERYDIDQKLKRDQQRNRRLLYRLQNQKSRIREQWASKKQNQSYFDQPIISLQPIKPIKKKTIVLKQYKSVSMKLHNQTRKLSPSIALLLQLKNFSQLKQKKDAQLQSLIKNQYQNRQQTMTNKNNYYSDSISFKTLNPTVQFQMRKLMDDKLAHRLKVCKDQAQNFRKFLDYLKKSRTIICKPLQQIFQKLRISVLSGKILKQRDFVDVLVDYEDVKQLKLPTNASILRRLKAVMI